MINKVVSDGGVYRFHISNVLHVYKLDFPKLIIIRRVR